MKSDNFDIDINTPWEEIKGIMVDTLTSMKHRDSKLIEVTLMAAYAKGQVDSANAISLEFQRLNSRNKGTVQ